jgi:serine/threonine-protein kinase
LPLVHEWGHDGSDFFVVRDYIPGADLELELGQQDRFAPITAARYGEDAAGALAQIHGRGLVHGNVRTANIIRTPEDEIVLVGNSLGLAEPGLPPGARPAAAYYLAPEQVEGGALSPATDVYAMGVVLYELVSGHVPFDGPTAAAVADQHLHAVPQPLTDTVPDVPPALETVIMRALDKAPGARYADGGSLRAALQAVAEPPVSISAVPSARSPWPWVLGGLLVIVAGLGIAWAMGGFNAKQATVPDVVGMTQAGASAALSAAGLELGVVTYTGKPVSGVADGSVSSQAPVQGTKVGPSTKVDLVLAGAESVSVPDVVGLTQTQAALDLQKAGLAVGAITNVATTSVGVGMVLGQTPSAGASVAKGTAIDLRVSQNTLAVPDVTNALQADARATLESAGFVVAVTTRASPTVSSGRVIEQNPTAGVSARPGSTITIVVSNGPALVAVPDVRTMAQADAVNALTAAGFKSQIVLQTGGGPVGTVISQSPAAGADVAAGSTVRITVVQ